MKLLVGVDGGEGSFRALEAGIEQSEARPDGELAVAVVDNPDVDVDLDTVEREVRDRLETAVVRATITVLEGEHPGSALVEFAEREGFDRVLINGGEKSPMGKISIGGLTEFVLLNSHVTVTLVR